MKNNDKIFNMKFSRLLSKESLVILGAFFVVLGLTLLMVVLTDDKSDQEEENEIPKVTEREFKQASGFDTESIASYNSAEECWIIYGDNVYDITGILDSLSDITVNNCGTDLTDKISSTSAQSITPYLVAHTKN